MAYHFIEEYDIIVIGAGHAGVEASLLLVVWAVRYYLRPLISRCWPLCLVIHQLVVLLRGLLSVK